MRERDWKQGGLSWVGMAQIKIEDKALRLLAAFERAGKSVGRVTVDGKKIELTLVEVGPVDEFETVEMTHGKA
jgi:hypothetical protein